LGGEAGSAEGTGVEVAVEAGEIGCGIAGGERGERGEVRLFDVIRV